MADFQLLREIWNTSKEADFVNFGNQDGNNNSHEKQIENNIYTERTLWYSRIMTSPGDH